MSAEWIDRAGALARGEHAPEGWTVIRGERPAILDQEGVRAIVAPLVAVLAWTGAVFREMVADSPIDPLAIVMRLIALAMTVRAILLGRALVRRLGAWSASSRSVLVLAPEGLFARLPEGDIALEKHEIVAITERGTWQGRASGRRFSPVYVVSLSPLRTYLELPAIFDATPGVLAERLMRWRGAIAVPETPAFPEPAALASKVYEDAARGIREPGTIVIHHGNGWLERGPWASVLLGTVVVEGFVRAGAVLQATIGPAPIVAAAAALVMIPIVWVWAQRRSMAPQLGMAMVITPAELLMRTRGGVLRVAWPKLQRLSIDVRGRASILEGWSMRRALVIKRKDGLPITYDEAFLGVPAEVALELCEAYARGAHLVSPQDVSRQELASGEQPSSAQQGAELAHPAPESGAEHGDRGPGDPGDT